MVQYTFNLQVKDIEDKYEYPIDLNQSQEDNPASFFTRSEREKMRASFQEKSLCKISNYHLNQIIKIWIQDIEEGYRESSLTLDLSLMIESDISQMKEPGNQAMPHLVAPDLSGIEPTSGMLPPLNFS